MVATEKISRKFVALDGYLAVLEELAQMPTDEFVRDKILILKPRSPSSF